MPQAVSNEEEAEKKAQEEQLKKEAQEAMKELEEAKEAQKAKATTAAAETVKETQKETTQQETTKKETTAAQTVGIIDANPEKGEDQTVAAPTTQKETQKETEKSTQENKGPGSDTGSSDVDSATRNAVIAYAKQFLGNPYKYGGTSLTNGADCSGFVMSVFSHFGISTGRSSRDQAGKGREIPVDSVQPGDLLFYASGGYINHVGIYIGGGQIIHASNPSTGICLAPSNYRTPCKAVTFF